MNLYLLVEGRSTEKKVYPKMLNVFLGGALQQVARIEKVVTNNFFLLNANGYPQIFTSILGRTIEDINDHGQIHYLIICIDADEGSVEDRELELQDHLTRLRSEGVVLMTQCELKLVVQSRCIETWFLGNKKIYKDNPEGEELRKYQNFYNVREFDPELLPKHPNFNTHSAFHFAYLREMLRERNVRYTKNFPRDVAEQHYLEELTSRAITDGHISTYYDFYEFCQMLRSKLAL